VKLLEADSDVLSVSKKCGAWVWQTDRPTKLAQRVPCFATNSRTKALSDTAVTTCDVDAMIKN